MFKTTDFTSIITQLPKIEYSRLSKLTIPKKILKTEADLWEKLQ